MINDMKELRKLEEYFLNLHYDKVSDWVKKNPTIEINNQYCLQEITHGRVKLLPRHEVIYRDNAHKLVNLFDFSDAVNKNKDIDKEETTYRRSLKEELYTLIDEVVFSDLTPEDAIKKAKGVK